MGKPSHIHLSDLQGISRLARDATVGLTDIAEAMHHTIARTPGIVGKPPKGRTKGITGLVYRSVRGVTRLVGNGVEASLGLLAPLIAKRRPSREREAVLAALNGVLGDYLAATGNPLAIPMSLRKAGKPLELTRASLADAYPAPGRNLLVLVHGLCMNDLQWNRNGHDHGAALARDLGYTPVYVHFNTGLHVSENGRKFDDLMERLLKKWPHPVEELTILGHSMGGLVVRSACHHAALAGHTWQKRLDNLVFLGTPHFGAPLERAGARADFLLGISPYTAPFARLGKVRSAGIKDLSHGYLRDEDWQAARAARRAMPLPAGVRCFAVAASNREGPTGAGSGAGGDGLVPVASALGLHRDLSSRLAIPESRRWVGHGMGHFDLLDRAEVYGRIRDWLAARPASAEAHR